MRKVYMIRVWCSRKRKALEKTKGLEEPSTLIHNVGMEQGDSVRIFPDTFYRNWMWVYRGTVKNRSCTLYCLRPIALSDAISTNLPLTLSIQTIFCIVSQKKHSKVIRI